MRYAVSATRTEQGIRERALARTIAPALVAAQAQADRERKARIATEERLAEAMEVIAGLKEAVAKLEEADLTRGSQISGKIVMAEVSRKREVPLYILTGTDRSVIVARARHEAMYEIRRRCPWLSLPAIGDLFGGRDHTTVMHAVEDWPNKAAKAGIEVLPLERREA